MAAIPVGVLMTRLEADPTDQDHILAELQKRYGERLLTVFRYRGIRCPLHRDELVQMVWVKLWQRCSKPGGWQPGAGEDPLWSFLAVIAKNLARDVHRRRHSSHKRWATFCDEVQHVGADQRPSAATTAGETGETKLRGPRVRPVGTMSRRERARLEKAALEKFPKLPADKRKLLQLVADGHTTRQIGAKVNRNPGRVVLDLQKARCELVALAGGKGEEGDQSADHSSPPPARHSRRRSGASCRPPAVDVAHVRSDLEGGRPIAV